MPVPIMAPTRAADLVVRDSRREVIAIGEAKSGETIGTRHLFRLQRATELLRAGSAGVLISFVRAAVSAHDGVHGIVRVLPGRALDREP